MQASNSFSLARILAAPWQQRSNLGGRWSLVLVVLACLAVPALLFVASLLADRPAKADTLRLGAARSVWICLFALVAVGWAMLVGNVLQQNHPTLARLVPHHPGQLRTALLVAWAMASLAAAAMPGFAFDAPLAWGCGAAGGLALFAAGLRWPMLWLSGIAAPFLVDAVTRRVDAAEFGNAVAARWAAHDVLWTAVVLTAGALILVSLVGNGGARHRQAYESRRQLHVALRAGQFVGGDCAWLNRMAWLSGLDGHRRLYRWWFDRLLARPDSAVMSRLLAGLGPATHWTSRVSETFWFLAIAGGGVFLVVINVFGGVLRAGIVPWIAYTVVTGVCTNALQAVPRLEQTRREQALLVLLPGVPRGAPLNRWLAGRMSLTFLVAAACAFALGWAFDAYAEALEPGIVDRVNGGMTAGIAAALLPQVAWQWRRWAFLRGSSVMAQTLPVLTAVLSGIAILALHAITGIGYVAWGVTLAIAALAWCAWRWHRMGSEPTALPVGRLA